MTVNTLTRRPLRPIDMAAAGQRGRSPAATGRCRTCGSGTTDSKPYCIDHLDHGGYVRALKALGEARFDEVGNVLEELESGRSPQLASKRIDARGSFAVEVLDALIGLKCMHMAQVCDVVDFIQTKRIQVGEAYAWALHKAGLARLTHIKTRRGQIVPILVAS